MTALPPEVLAELQAEYLASFSEIFSVLRQALAAKDWPTIEKHFHRFAGSGKTYGLPDITDVGRAIETYIQQNPTPSPVILEEALMLFEQIITNYKNGSTLPTEARTAILKKIA